MDPVSMIVTALAAGAAAATKDTVSQAVKDAYAGLKALVQSRFANKPKAQRVLVEFEKDPDTWEKPLQKSLEASGVDTDPAIIQHAQRVLQLVQPQQYSQGKYNVQVTGNAKGRSWVTTLVRRISSVVNPPSPSWHFTLRRVVGVISYSVHAVVQG